MSEEREAFEAWLIGCGNADEISFEKLKEGDRVFDEYANKEIEAMWLAWKARAAAGRASLEAVPDGWTPASGMTAHRAAFFMERFKREEKLLGPNEQAAVDFVLAMLSAAPAQPAQQPGYCRKIGGCECAPEAMEGCISFRQYPDQPAQQERQPMTDEERGRVFGAAEAAMTIDPNLAWRHAIVNAVERHHGIRKE